MLKDDLTPPMRGEGAGELETMGLEAEVTRVVGVCPSEKLSLNLWYEA